MLHSLLTQHPDGEARIAYLHGEDTSARGRRLLARMVERLDAEISFHSIPDRWLRGLPVKGFTGKATWYRLFLPQLLAGQDRVLHLDCDLLVLDSLRPLWHTDLLGNLVGAVTNIPMRENVGRAAQLGLANPSSYFNAGVLLMDLELMRREGISDQLVACGRRDPARVGWRDQDVLNLVLQRRRLPLAPRWNCMNSVMSFSWASEYFTEEELREARERPAIRHFEGPALNKPWHVLCEPANRRLYIQHRRQTPWPRVRPVGCTPGNLLSYVRGNRSIAYRGESR